MAGMERIASGRGDAPPRRSLTPALLTIVLLQGSLYLGMQAGPWLAQLRRPSFRRAAAEDAARSRQRIAQWRRAQYRAAADPRVGKPAPVDAVRTAEGKRVSLAAGPGRRTALLFVGDGAG